MARIVLVSKREPSSLTDGQLKTLRHIYGFDVTLVRTELGEENADILRRLEYHIVMPITDDMRIADICAALGSMENAVAIRKPDGPCIVVVPFLHH